jgi:multidrug efflux pump subunit AcrA (membrane-fusion protein)
MLAWGCHSGSDTSTDGGSDVVKTPATAVTVGVASLQEDQWVNATSTFLNSSVVASTITGYVTRSSLYPGQYVSAGQVLFTLQTREASILADQLPDSLKFNGKIKIKAPLTGFIAQLNHQQGDYVQQGEQLCVIASASSFAFIMQVPFDLVGDVRLHAPVTLQLPDSRVITGRVISEMPSMDSVSQTQAYLIRVDPSLRLPQNMIARVKIIRQSVQNAQVVPKETVLSDETESQFWVMKVINDSTAVKIKVQKGVEDSRNVQILSPRFAPGTRLLNAGNYGLPDTAMVILGKSSTP